MAEVEAAVVGEGEDELELEEPIPDSQHPIVTEAIEIPNTIGYKEMKEYCKKYDEYANRRILKRSVSDFMSSAPVLNPVQVHGPLTEKLLAKSKSTGSMPTAKLTSYEDKVEFNFNDYADEYEKMTHRMLSDLDLNHLNCKKGTIELADHFTKVKFIKDAHEWWGNHRSTINKGPNTESLRSLTRQSSSKSFLTYEPDDDITPGSRRRFKGAPNRWKLPPLEKQPRLRKVPYPPFPPHVAVPQVEEPPVEKKKKKKKKKKVEGEGEEGEAPPEGEEGEKKEGEEGEEEEEDDEEEEEEGEEGEKKEGEPAQE